MRQVLGALLLLVGAWSIAARAEHQGGSPLPFPIPTGARPVDEGAVGGRAPAPPFPCDLKTTRLDKLPRLILVRDDGHKLAAQETLTTEAKDGKCVLGTNGTYCIDDTAIASEKAREAMAALQKNRIFGIEDPLANDLARLLRVYDRVLNNPDLGGAPARDLVRALGQQRYLQDSWKSVVAKDLPWGSDEEGQIAKDLSGIGSPEQAEAFLKGLRAEDVFATDSQALAGVLRRWIGAFGVMATQRKVAAEHAVPADLSALLKDFLRQKDRVGPLQKITVDWGNRLRAENIAKLYCKEAVPRLLPLHVTVDADQAEGLATLLKEMSSGRVAVQTVDAREFDVGLQKALDELKKTLDELNKRLPIAPGGVGELPPLGGGPGGLREGGQSGGATPPGQEPEPQPPGQPPQLPPPPSFEPSPVRRFPPRVPTPRPMRGPLGTRVF